MSTITRTQYNNFFGGTFFWVQFFCGQFLGRQFFGRKFAGDNFPGAIFQGAIFRGFFPWGNFSGHCLFHSHIIFDSLELLRRIFSVGNDVNIQREKNQNQNEMFGNFIGTNAVSQVVQKSYLSYHQACESYLQDLCNFSCIQSYLNWTIDFKQTNYLLFKQLAGDW